VGAININKKNKLVAFLVSKLECCVSGRKKDMG
jgi:hypothetical protein